MEGKVFTLVFTLCVQLVLGQTVDVNVEPYGTVVGTYEQTGNLAFTRVNKFLGVPYAKAPTGSRRFKPPEQHEGWSPDEMMATSFKQPCLQLNNGSPLGSEDCLYLNIYVPGMITARQNNPIPVMVFIHGGSGHGFTSGSASDYSGSEITKYEDSANVVLVTLSYRLGVFGFLSSGDSVVPGNMGLKDQAFALQWIRDNIGYFGGDNTKITIFGQGIGGLAVKTHIFSPMNENKFQRAIIQSGLSAWKFPDKSYHVNSFVQLGRELTCESDSAGILACLQGKDAMDILSAQTAPVFSLPLIDGEFITMDLEDSLANWNSNQVDLLVGFNSDEGTALLNTYPSLERDIFLAVGAPADRPEIGVYFGYCVNIVVSELSIMYDPQFTYAKDVEGITNIPELIAMVRNEYMPDDSDPFTNGRRLLDAVRDCAYIVQSIQMAEKLASAEGKAYVYYFNHRTAALPQHPDANIALGAPHGGELDYVFGDGTFTNSEGILSESMMLAWTTFAKNGEPTYYDLGYNEDSWPAYTTAGKNMLVFDLESLSPTGDKTQQINDTFYRVLRFWSSVPDSAAYAEQETEPGSPEVGQQRDSEEEFETEYLKLDKFEADLTIILLAIGAFFLLLLVIGLTCKICCSNSKESSSEEKYAY